RTEASRSESSPTEASRPATAPPAAQQGTAPPATARPDQARPAPAAVPAAGPSGDGASAEKSLGTVEVTDVRRVWTEILAAVQRIRRTTQILLASATVASVGGGALHLTMPAAGMARRVVEPANADVLRAALKEVLGVDWMIRCE